MWFFKIELVHYKVIFLSAYSPDLNPIEKTWANIKILDPYRQKRMLVTKRYDALF